MKTSRAVYFGKRFKKPLSKTPVYRGISLEDAYIHAMSGGFSPSADYRTISTVLAEEVMRLRMIPSQKKRRNTK